MKRISTLLLIVFCFGITARAQTEPDARTKKMLEQAAKNGNGLQTQITVNGNVHAQAVLIPRVDAKRIFGSEIANNYAVIEVNVGNKSPDAALIIHGIFIDYHKWPLSGATPAELNAARSTDNFQASTFPHEVASEEYRVVRGQLLDAQTDTLRNRFLRWLTLAGNLAGAFTFSIGEQGIVKGIAAATGVGIPGVATAWPDKIIEQLNRVSDFGFQANKVVPKQGSEVIVCFFPIDRFLTPGFRKLFLKSPALFFAPGQMLVDKSVEKDVDNIMGELLKEQGLTLSNLRGSLPCYLTVAHPTPGDAAYPVCLDEFGLELKDKQSIQSGYQVKLKDGKPDVDAVKKFKVFMALAFIGSVSLNRVVITVDGVMAVDVKTIAARIDGVEINSVASCGDAGSECLWTNISAGSGTRKGIIRGSYLTGGMVVIADARDLGISDLKTLPDESTDQELHFSFKLAMPIKNQTKLHFTVSKPQPASTTANGKPLDSVTFEYGVAYSLSAVGIESVLSNGTKLTVTGSGFTKTPLAVTLRSEGRKPVEVAAANIKVTADNQLEVTLPTDAKKLDAGCWYVQVKTGDVSSNESNNFAVAPHPAIVNADRNDSFIQLKGTDLLDFSRCGGRPKITFKLQRTDAPLPKPIDVVEADWSRGQPVIELPDAVKTGTWTIQLVVDGTATGTAVALHVIGQ